MDLTHKRVLITGGAGLIGSHIVDYLCRLPVGEIVVYDSLVRGRRDNVAHVLADRRVRLVKADIRDRTALTQALDGIDAVFHLAAIRITQCAEDPRLAFDVLGNGTFTLLEAAVAARVSKVVAASSASIYGLADQFPTHESHHPYHNRTLYGALKLWNEGLLRSFSEMYGLEYVALRYFNVYGPRMDTYGAYTEVLIRWMERISAGEPPLIFGDGHQTMDFVYVEDIARATVLAMQSAATDQVFNVASGMETSLLALAEALLHVMGSNLRPIFGPERKVNPVPRRLADTHAAAEQLGFRASVDLEEGLRRLVTWWQSTQMAPVTEVLP